MRFAPGQRVHVAALGTGVVLEVRNAGRCLVEIKGRAVEVTAGQLADAPADPKTRRRRAAVPPPPAEQTRLRPARGVPSSIDLHGRTVDEAVEALDRFLNDALLAGLSEVHVIHGRSGGRIKAAVHARLRALPVVRGFRVDGRNAGVTVVAF